MTFRTWWIAYGDLVRKLVALVASFASMAGLLVAFLPSPEEMPWWAVALLLTAVFAFMVLILFREGSPT